MPTSTSLEETAPVTLRINADNPAAEVFLLDPQLQLVARGVGSLVTEQVPGVYKLRVRLGRETLDKLMLLEKDTTESISAPAFGSPAPLASTALTHEYHITAAEKYSAQPMVTVGDGSSIFVFVRYFTPSPRQPGKEGHPARDLSLCRLDGTRLVDFASASATGYSPDTWAACHVRLDPGAYLLECRTSGAPLARTIIASQEWQTQVFLMRSAGDVATGETTTATGFFHSGSVLMSAGAFDSKAFDLRLTELARIALADERPILGQMLRQLLLEKFTNPMEGILGAHLMLLSRDRPLASSATTAPDPEDPFNQDLFDTVIANLRGLVGRAHPDVEALSVRCAKAGDRTSTAFTVPPMLRRSWSLMVEASNTRPEIVDPMLWDRVMARTTAAPFLSWLVVSGDTRTAVQNSLREAVDSRRKMQDAAPPARVARSAAPRAGAGEQGFRRGLSVELDIPRIAVDQMFDKK